MTHTIYFADKSVCFASEVLPGEGACYTPTIGNPLSRDKILKILETHNSVTIISVDVERVFEEFKANFVEVVAAGGVVVNGRGEWLMIHRNGRWDFPKGHLEEGESLLACAVREVEEETGVASEVTRPLCETFHAYYFAKTARWELKRTHWYELRLPASLGADAKLSPQTEEGIEQVAWCPPAAVAEYLEGAFPTIRCVAEAMG